MLLIIHLELYSKFRNLTYAHMSGWFRQTKTIVTVSEFTSHALKKIYAKYVTLQILEV